ncbi:PTS transporter subunit EIIB, partial [Streptococcus suis]|uniref:PTS transporter subunit EIIB n=1 Tax=Streptococcus suis TaxID=1307 RepID=UPI0026C330B6
MKNTKDVAKQVLENVGGRENILGNAVCMTRLRLQLRDDKLVHLDSLKNIEGVLGVVEADTLQIVFGPGTVTKVGQAFSELTGISLGSVEEDYTTADVAATNKRINKEKYDKPVQRFLQKIANIFIPILPGIIAAGLINGITNVINVSTGNAFAMEWWYQCIRTMSWGLFTLWLRASFSRREKQENHQLCWWLPRL